MNSLLCQYFQHLKCFPARRSLALRTDFRLPLKRNYGASSPATDSSSETSIPKGASEKTSNDDIVIPYRIERSSTDILQALASTVSRDYTAPHYRYHDDPYLIPTSNLAKRSFALSKESGKKAAKWAREQMPELFYHKNADPPIMPYLPDPTLQNVKEVTEETIMCFADLGLLTEAAKAYDVLLANKQDLSPEGKQALLEAAAFHNSIDVEDEEWMEQRWYQNSIVNYDRLKNTWNSDGLAERIFSSIENPDGHAYGAMIQGLAKYMHIEKAYTLYTQAKEKSVPLSVETYNSILGITNFVREQADMRIELQDEILRDMAKAGVSPNKGTMAAALENCALCRSGKLAKTLTPKYWAEFIRLGVEPSLASYYFLLIAYCNRKDQVATSNALYLIMDEIEGKKFEIEHPKDTSFISAAMELACTVYQDIDLADRVHRFALSGSHYNLIGDSFRESIYYRNFFTLRLNNEELDQFFNFYDILVPNVYVPEISIMLGILEAVDVNAEPRYIPKLWSDLVVFDLHLKDKIIGPFLHLMASLMPSASTPEVDKLRDEMAEVAWKIWSLLENQDPTKGMYVPWTGKMLGDVMSVLVKHGDLQKASNVLRKLANSGRKIVGVPSIHSLRDLLDACIQDNNVPLALACIQYTNDAGYPEAIVFGEDLVIACSLDALQISKLNNILGCNVEANASAKRVAQAQSDTVVSS